GSFSSSSREHASGPIKQLFAKLKRRCCTRLISEFRNSQICSRYKDRFTYPQCYYALKVCRSNCLTLWNSDVNAARNIRDIFKYMCNNYGCRSHIFTRNNAS
ncbi:18434_t:CDS:2, partial [Funneliformis geosporum]